MYFTKINIINIWYKFRIFKNRSCYNINMFDTNHKHKMEPFSNINVIFVYLRYKINQKLRTSRWIYLFLPTWMSLIKMYETRTALSAHFRKYENPHIKIFYVFRSKRKKSPYPLMYSFHQAKRMRYTVFHRWCTKIERNPPSIRLSGLYLK